MFVLTQRAHYSFVRLLDSKYVRLIPSIALCVGLVACLDESSGGDSGASANTSSQMQSGTSAVASAGSSASSASSSGGSASPSTNTSSGSSPSAPSVSNPATGSTVVQLAGSGSPLPVGWSMLPNSQLSNVCPPAGFGGEDYNFKFMCQYVVSAWNSAAMDSKRNRLIVWGGGHGDYGGNEVYSVNLSNYRIERLTNPSVPIARTGTEPEALGDGAANSRHTYDGLTYLESTDKMFAVGGSLAALGNFSRATWTFDLATNRWQNMNPAGSLPAKDPGLIAVYDAVSDRVFVHDSWSLYAYDVKANRYDRLATDNATDYHLTGVIDPVNRKFVMIGAGRAYMYDIGPSSTYSREVLNTSGGSAIVGANYPGLAYDPVSRRIIAWHGGSTIYALDLNSKVWSSISFPQGPGAAQRNGTYKRFNYSRQLDAFVLVNAMNENVYLLKLPR